GRGGRADVRDPRRLPGRLHVHAEVDQVHQPLRLTLRLHVRAHYAEDEPRLSTARGERGDDGVEGPLVRLEPVGAGQIERELRSTGLPGGPQLSRDHARAQVEVDALDERHAVPLRVDHGEVYRVAPRWLSRRQPDAGAARIDQLAPLGRVALRDQLLHGDLRFLRIGDEAGAIGPGDLFGFDDKVPV